MRLSLLLVYNFVKVLVYLFNDAVNCWFEKDKKLLDDNCSEPAMCGALMVHLNEKIKNTLFEDYHADVEYNRNEGSTKSKGAKIKTIYDVNGFQNSGFISIICDLVLHSRGNNKQQDNLIAVEMKKASALDDDKMEDRARLKALTNNISKGVVYNPDGKTLPQDVCRYILGIFIEIDTKNSELKIEYYRKGELDPMAKELAEYNNENV